MQYIRKTGEVAPVFYLSRLAVHAPPETTLTPQSDTDDARAEEKKRRGLGNLRRVLDF